jgi:hypothetical protein
MKRTLLFVGLLLIILVIFSNFQEGLEQIPNFNSASKKMAIFEALLKLRDTPMSVLENTPLLSVSFRESIHNFITPEELKSRPLTDFYTYLTSEDTLKTNIKFIKDISTTNLDTLKSRKDLFFLGFDKFIYETDLNITGITGGMKIPQAIEILRPLAAAEAQAAAQAAAAQSAPQAAAPPVQ